MTEGNMTGRPYGGTNSTDGGPLPGERPDDDEVTAAPEQSPRAAQGPLGSGSGEADAGSATAPNSPGPPG